MGRAAKRRAILDRGRTPGSYTAWPHACARSEHYRALSAHAKALLLDFLSQYNGNNNGDLCCAFKTLKPRGWKSRTTIEKARAELEKVGWIVRTLRGWRNKPNLYALTIFKINDIAKLEARETDKPLGFWQQGSNPWLTDKIQPRPTGTIFSKYSSCATRPRLARGLGNPRL